MKSGKQQLLTELVLRDLYEELKELKNKDKIHTCEIYLGESDEPEDQKKVSILDSLKKLKVISSYSTETVEEMVSSPIPGEEGMYDDVSLIKASVKLSPSKVIQHIKEISKAKEKQLTALSKLFTGMIDIMRFYAKDSLSVDDDLNQTYIQISKDIDDLLKDKLLYNFKSKYKKPFTDLFLAEKELKNKDSDIDTVIEKLSAFLGEVKHQISKIKTFVDGKIEVNVDEVLAGMRKSTNVQQAKYESNFAIIMDEDGDFYYKGKKIERMGKNTIYVYILECLCKQLEGFATYEQINRYLVEKGKGNVSDRDKQIERIQNGIKGLFRWSTLKNIKNKKQIIYPERGEGLQLYKIKTK